MKLNSTNLSEIKLGQPVLAEGVYFAKLSVAVSPNKAKTGNNLVVTAKLLDETVVRREDGEEIENKGIKITRYISLVPTDNYNPDESLKQLALAVGMEDPSEVNTEDIDGKCTKVMLAYSPANDRFGESNDLKRFLKIVPEDGFNEPA